MRLAWLRWLRAKLDETRLHIPVDIRYVGRGPGGGLIVTSDAPRAMLMRRVVLRTTYEPITTRRWNLGPLNVDLNLGIPSRWHLDHCGMVELSTEKMPLTISPVPVICFGPNAPSMMRAVVLKGPLRIQATVGGLAGLVRLFVGGRILAEVEGTIAQNKPRTAKPGIERLRSFVESMP